MNEGNLGECELPRLILGGMGIDVSTWRLARVISQSGHLGTVSLTGYWVVMVRQLQLGDPNGNIRRALNNFPSERIREDILNRYFRSSGMPTGEPFLNTPMLTHPINRHLKELMVAASFVDVWLAKEGHNGLIAANLLEKLQLTLLPCIYGAMLAGVDYVLMGAGIPLQVAEVLDRLADGKSAAYRFQVEDAEKSDVFEQIFDPGQLSLDVQMSLRRPRWMPIISLDPLARILTDRSNGTIDGFIVEHHTAGGHNAPPRGGGAAASEVHYGPRDEPNLKKLIDLGLPFWLAGSRSHPTSLCEAQAQGAAGIQVGSIFALCQESGFRPDIKNQIIESYMAGTLVEHTDGRLSPSGYPFRMVDLPGTAIDPNMPIRKPFCDTSCLATPYKRADGKVGMRCPAEPPETFIKKGGSPHEIEGRRCLCNGLLSAIGLPQLRRTPHGTDQVELPLVTCGQDLSFLDVLGSHGSYPAAEALAYLGLK